MFFGLTQAQSFSQAHAFGLEGLQLRRQLGIRHIAVPYRGDQPIDLLLDSIEPLAHACGVAARLAFQLGPFDVQGPCHLFDQLGIGQVLADALENARFKPFQVIALAVAARAVGRGGRASHARRPLGRPRPLFGDAAILAIR